MSSAGWQPARRKPSIPVTLLMGPLGAGKTTFLNRLLAEPAFADTAVIVNETGATALDADVITETGDGFVALGAGCVCCTLRGELAEALERLLRGLDNARIPRIARVIIETAGGADPAPIFALLTRHPYLSLRFHLDRIIAMPSAGANLTDEATLRQLASADRIILTDAGAPDAWIEPVRALNPEAICETAGATVAALAAGTDDGVATRSAPGATNGAVAFTIIRDAAMPGGALEAFLDEAATRFGGALIRVKGLVALSDTPDRPALVHGLGAVFALPRLLPAWPDADRRTRLAVHARGLDRRAFETLLDAYAGALAVDTPDRAAMMDNPLAIGGFRPR